MNEWVTEAELAARTGFCDADTRRIVLALVKATLVEATQLAATETPRADEWSAWGPAAEFFHFSTRNTRFNEDVVAGERRLVHKANESVPPPIRQIKGQRTPLPAKMSSSSFGEVLQARRTWRTFSPRALSLVDLARLLKLTTGVQHWATCPARGRIPLKTFPSGGACHPIETYVAAVNVRDVVPGLYHYDSSSHELVLVKVGASPATIESFIQGQPWFSAAPVLLIFTAVFGRTAWRYPVAKAYRNVLLEAGHICQTFCLTATEMGLAPFCTQAVAEDVVDAALGLDGVHEGVVYVAGCGQRPSDGWSLGLPLSDIAVAR